MPHQVHVVPRQHEWAIIVKALVDGEWKTIDEQPQPTQKLAILVARRIAKKKKAELMIHGRGSRGIRQKNSYGNDPQRTRG